MVIGDKVRLVQLPASILAGNAHEETLTVFRKCLGKKFRVADFNEVGWAELHVGSVTKKRCETIWVEQELLEKV
jgi:hypothetical protein